MHLIPHFHRRHPYAKAAFTAVVAISAAIAVVIATAPRTALAGVIVSAQLDRAARG